MRRYGTQVFYVALIIALGTYDSVVLGVPPSPWNVLWMVVFPVAVGLALNRGAARVIMAGTLFIVSWIAAGLVGTTMGGM